MMTDITELVQRLATGAKEGAYPVLSPTECGALVEALEKARLRITQLESRTVTDWIEHDGKWRPESLGLDELVYLKTRKQELKIPYPAGKVKGWMNTGGDMDVMAYKLASPQAITVTVNLLDCDLDAVLNMSGGSKDYCNGFVDGTQNAIIEMRAAGIDVREDE